MLSHETKDDGEKVTLLTQVLGDGTFDGMRDLREILLLRLYKSQEPAPFEKDAAWPPAEHKGLLIHDTASGATSWRSEAYYAKLARGVKHMPKDELKRISNTSFSTFS